MKFQDVPIGGGFRLSPELTSVVYIRTGENEWCDPRQNLSPHFWVHPINLEEIKRNPAFARDQRVFPAVLEPVTVTFPCAEVAQWAAETTNRGMTGNTGQSYGEQLHLSAMRSFNEVLEEPVGGPFLRRQNE